MAMKRVLCFGDSLTWGWVPVEDGVPTERYPRDVRWTGVLADELGADYTVIEEGLSARTTSADDPSDPRLNGAAYLPACLASHLPLDLVVIMLGTNDTKAYFHREPLDIAMGMGILVTQVLTAAGGVGTVYPAPRTLVVAPPPLAQIPHPWFDLIFAGGHEKTAALSSAYSALASHMKVDFFDAGSVISTDGVDGIHFTEQNNRDLGAALAAQVRTLLS
ncbi:SGNH/GDSL hydrolase family protein [Mycolicibacterium monacense]|uniref:Hydrolase n=2 Tax=Mycobacteriaceae TaxID=1762 RepID=A0AAD1J016_MYCMB|nr:SGNH/GDSL hydrolase family protein [Mycolicibacterium monacense]MDA4103266.1 hydrolase [Mycolicibacterium monacense DSM 44395]OBF56183.1 hydrolase [Mycolicibacterium monacense]ORB12915.1 hydrolase [Mycolicibacterium monacense DSM 44395]QHP88863.1 hydrolase [Mycolicibacterium monacense DSM 44395]BBZ63678.1 hydrolase [Mycolicibacterium monacense]